MSSMQEHQCNSWQPIREHKVRKFLKRFLIATLIIYAGAEIYLHRIPRAIYVWAVNHDAKDCIGWICDEVQCPDGYAIWIPGKDGFLPCRNFEKYIETRDVMLLVGYDEE